MNSVTPQQTTANSPKLVSIGVPIYKRLEYLPGVLRMVQSQDYPSIELIVSDNGQNGTTVRDMVAAQYSRPHKFRQNPTTVDVISHHNQIINAASGEYFFLLSDDDEISDNFISELARLLDGHPEASLAYARQEIINREGSVLRKTKEPLPEKLSGAEFINLTWGRYQYAYENLEGFLTRTKLWRETGGYPAFSKGNHSDDGAVIRLCLDHEVVFSSKCVHRYRVTPGSLYRTVSMKELGSASAEFLAWLDTDPTVLHYAANHPEKWRELKDVLSRMIWGNYLWRWRDIYRNRLTAGQWAREAFRLPYIPAYYRQVASILAADAKSRIRGMLRRSSRGETRPLTPGSENVETRTKDR